jgi:hypothetical protein
MTVQTQSADTAQGVDDHVAELYRDGITSLRRAFPRDWVERLREDMDAAYREAVVRPGGTVPRGPQRWYVEVHPEDVRGFVDLVSHPWVRAMSEAVLGTDHRVVEIGFDVPFKGAKDQPWHRDFASPPATYEQRRLTSLAFNLTGVDVTPDMGPFEIAPGTQWDDGRAWKHEMFPPRDEWPRYAALGQRRFPRMGDLSCRTALALHRGTEHASETSRPVLILGVVAGEVANPDEHDLEITRTYHARLPVEVREHLLCRVVDVLTPLTQRHDIEGLEMGVES